MDVEKGQKQEGNIKRRQNILTFIAFFRTNEFSVRVRPSRVVSRMFSSVGGGREGVSSKVITLGFGGHNLAESVFI